MRIKEVQEAYANAIYADDTHSLESMIYSSEVFTSAQRVNVYQNNTIGTLKETLSSVYSVCEALVGKDYFNQLASHYVRHYPSIHRNLDEYGDLFPESLEQLIQKREELKDLAYLADVAGLEWLVHQAYFAPDREVFDITEFAQLSADQQMQVQFELAKDIALLDSPYPVYDIWKSHQDDVSSHVAPIAQGEHNYILVQRERLKTEAKLIDARLFAVLAAIKYGTPLIDLTALLEESPLDIAMLIQQGVVAGFKTFKTSHD